VKSISTTVLLLLTLLVPGAVLSSTNTAFDLPSDFVRADAVIYNVKWDVLNDNSLLLFKRDGGFWLLDSASGHVRFFKAVSVNYFSYNSAYTDSYNAVVTLGNGGGTYICDQYMCQEDTFYLIYRDAKQWFHYFDKRNDLRAIWNDKDAASTYSYYFKTSGSAGEKKSWLGRLTNNQSITTKQDALVFSERIFTPEGEKTKNQIFDLNEGDLQNEITAEQFSPIKLTGNGRLWYSEASNISYEKYGVVRAGIVGAKDEVNLQSYEKQINEIMKKELSSWSYGKVLLIDAIEPLSDDASVVVRFRQKYMDGTYLSILNLKTGISTVLRDQTNKVAKVFSVWRIDRYKNRVFAQVGQNGISVWNPNGEYVGTLESALENVSDLRIAGSNHLYLIDFVKGKFEVMTIDL
jgi:hypothetical protein